MLNTPKPTISFGSLTSNSSEAEVGQAEVRVGSYLVRKEHTHAHTLTQTCSQTHINVHTHTHAHTLIHTNAHTHTR